MVPRVILEGAFYSPNASEGRWAWNIARCLDKMAGQGLLELDLFLPKHANDQYYFTDKEAWDHFPNAQKLYRTDRQYHVHFLIQPGGDQEWQYLNDGVYADRKVHGQFELYWYGSQIDKRKNLPENYEYCYAMEPYSPLPQNQNWPANGKRYYHLPYSPNYEPGSNNFDNKGILLTIKSPIHADYTDAEVEARLAHFEAALDFARQGMPVTIGYSNRLFINPKHYYHKELDGLIARLTMNGAKLVGNVSPLAMRDMIKQHSVVYTGKLENVILYASFMDALNYGSVPIIFNDWPEQFFEVSNLFTGWLGIDSLMQRTERLLSDREYYTRELELQRKYINLYTEEQMIEKLKGIIGCE